MDWLIDVTRLSPVSLSNREDRCPSVQQCFHNHRMNRPLTQDNQSCVVTMLRRAMPMFLVEGISSEYLRSQNRKPPCVRVEKRTRWNRPAQRTSIPVVCPLQSGVSRQISASWPRRTCSSFGATLEKISREASTPWDLAVWIRFSSPAAGKRRSQRTLLCTRFKI